MFRKLKSNNGITLMELMSAVVILGIVAAMAAPRFQKAVEKINFKTANRDLLSSMKLARSTAISTKQPCGVYFATGYKDGESLSKPMTYTIFSDIVNQDKFAFEAGDSVLRIDTLPPEFTMLETDIGTDAIVFQPNGSAGFIGGGNVFTLVITESLVGVEQQNVLASTGRVKTYSSVY